MPRASISCCKIVRISGRRGWLRHALLLAFCAVTYAIAPVVSFGWLLLAMGIAQCDPDERRMRLAYLGVFALLLLFLHAPWAAPPLQAPGSPVILR